MILSFKTIINGKPTHFVERIHSGLIQNEFSIQGDFMPQDYDFGFLNKTQPGKIHTIREDKNDRWKPGIKIDFFINARTKNMFRFAPRIPVVSIQTIEIIYYSDREVLMKDLPLKKKVIIDNKHLIDSDLLKLAQNDGFDTVEDFFAYFNSDFTGKIIHWTDKRY